MFMEPKGDLANFRTLGEIAEDHLPAAAQAVANLLLTEWNGEGLWQVRSTSAAAYIGIELRHAVSPGRSAYRWAENAGLTRNVDWISVSSDETRALLPNPVRMALVGSLIQGVTLDYLAGRTHGDLHLDNVVVGYENGRLSCPDRTYLIDLSAFELWAPLSRDIATLILSAIAPLARLGSPNPAAAAAALSRLVVGSKPVSSQLIPSTLARTVNSIKVATTRQIPSRLYRTWRRQYLLSLLAQSLIYTSYENVRSDGHWLYFLIAAHAARAALPRAISPAVSDSIERVSISAKGVGG
jgi:hypothetical protein